MSREIPDDDSLGWGIMITFSLVMLALIGGIVTYQHISATRRLATVPEKERAAALAHIERFHTAYPGAFVILKNGRVGKKVDYNRLRWCESGKPLTFSLSNRIRISHWVPKVERAVLPQDADYIALFNACTKA